MNKDNKIVTSGVGILDLLLVLFIGLKLGGIIKWSWVWVLCPFWIQFVILAIVFVVACILIYKECNKS